MKERKSNRGAEEEEGKENVDEEKPQEKWRGGAEGGGGEMRMVKIVRESEEGMEEVEKMKMRRSNW